MRCAIVTGASAGIGLATARRFAAEGYRTINLSRRPCPAAEVQHLACDLGDPEFLSAVEAELSRHTDGATQLVLIHNAASMYNDSATSTASADLRRVFEVNLVAPNSLNRFAIPRMRPGSAILYVGSTLSEKAVPGSFSYVTSKHAMVGMMRATCQDLAGSGIHTACICPGFTDTEMLREHVGTESLGLVQRLSAFGRLIEPEEIAEMLFWSAGNPVINGAVLHANLGQIER
ncbi:MAG: SDR family oxidoreductase [Pseudomonadales bacterium]